MKYQVIEKALHLVIDRELYNEAVVFKCFYWLCRDLDVDISGNETEYKVIIQSKEADTTLNWEDTLKKIRQGLIDFKLRDIVNQETKTIRELIVAKAFAHYETEEELQTEISDAVGFDPKNIQ